MTPLQQIAAALGWNLRINENFVTVSPAGMYGRDPATTTGLTWGYLGGNFSGVAVANGTVALTTAATNYIVANRTTGVVTVATTTTNWLAAGTYLQLYLVVAGASTVTSYDDFRQAIGGATGGGGMSNPMTTAGDLIVGGAAGAPGRLGIGTAGQVLSVSGGIAGWATPGAGGFTGGTLTSALNEAPTVAIASSAAPAIGAAAGNSISLTGTTTVTGFDTIAAGAFRRVVFAGALVLTHNATSLILPTAANITTVAGDVAEFLSLGAGNWRCIAYSRASGASLSGTASSRTPAEQAVTSAATVTPTFLNDAVVVTALAVATQLLNPTGTAIPNLGMTIRIKDNGTARALTYDTQYRAVGVTLPTTTVVNKTLYLAVIFNAADTKWDVIAVAQE